MYYAFIFVMCPSLLFLPSSTSAQNPEGFLTFRNCNIEFLYPEDWKNFITDDSKCEDPVNWGRYEDSDTQITFPQPSLSEKITPRVSIIVEPCCFDVTSRDAEGFSAIERNMSLEEYIDEEVLNDTSGGPNL
jgi:hypothetical protein